MQLSRNLSDNMNHKYFGIMYFVSTSMHLDWFIKVKNIIENDDEIYAMSF